MCKILVTTCLLVITLMIAACGGGAFAPSTTAPATQAPATGVAPTTAPAATNPPATTVVPTTAPAPANTLAPTPTVVPGPAVPTQAALALEGITQDMNENQFESLSANLNTILSDVVMAKGVKPETFEPVDVVTEFPADTSKFYAVVTTEDAPPGTRVKAQWVIVDVGDLAPPGLVITESEIEVEGSVNIGFSLTPDAGKLPAGAYKVDVYVDDAFDGSIGFQVQGAPQVSNDVISRIVPFHATDAQDEPVDNGGKFPSGVTRLAVAVYFVNAPPDTLLRGDWTAVDVGGIVPDNTPLTTTEKEVEGSGVLTLSITSESSLPDGTYKVDVSAGGAFTQSVELAVGGGTATNPSSQSAGNTGKIERAGEVKLDPAPDGVAGLAVDKNGNVYVGIAGGVLKIAPDGSQKKFGEPGDAFNAQDNKFIAVNAIAADDAGNLYAVDTTASQAQKADASGAFHKWGDSELYQPFGVALDAQGNVYLADTYNRRVAKFDPTGKLLAEFSKVEGGIAPLGIVVSPNGNVIVTDGIKHRIVVLDAEGNYLGEFGKQGTGPGEFNQPVALALHDNNLYVVDAGNGRVQVIDNQLKFVTEFGPFSAPRQIAIAADGTIYVSDFGAKNVQVFRAK